MRYLHLVYLAEWKNGALTGRADDPRAGERGEIPPRSDDENPFFTDGPYIETKEYIVGSRNV